MPSHDKLKPVRVEPAMYEALEKAAKNSRGTITGEVRERLAWSLREDAEKASDPTAAELVRRIRALLASLKLDTTGPWHADPFAHAAAQAGILALLDAVKPKGEAKPPTGTSGLFGISDAATLGVAHARLIVRNDQQSTGGDNG
jgi:hypothetical protein